MEDNTAVSVKNLTKAYRIWKEPSARLKAPLIELFHRSNGRRDISEVIDDVAAGRVFNENRYYHDFCALKDVSFELKKGDSIGIIGRNGSGKSTLLQMIAGTLTPTRGRVETKGRVAALLELGAGFNDEFTGRENVYMNGAILGLTKSEIDERFDRIADFANIGEFMDQPIKTYSSGMRVRLAFAVQAEVDPDILIVDEALSVGDIRFTMKCIRRMKELIANNTTLLFVSHDLSSIVNFCKEVIWVHDGEVIRRGDPKKVTLEYSNYMHYGTTQREAAEEDDEGNDEEESSDEQQDVDEVASFVSSADLFGENYPESVDFKIKWESLKHLPVDGNGKAKFLYAALRAEENPEQTRLFEGGENISVWLYFKIFDHIESPIVCADIYDMKGNLVTGNNSCFVDSHPSRLEKDHSYVVQFKTALPVLRNGEYTFVFGMSDGNYEKHTHICGIHDALPFEVKSKRLSQNHHMISQDSYEIEFHDAESDKSVTVDT